MNFPRPCSPAKRLPPGAKAAFTLVEVIVALGILMLVMTGTLAFVNGAAVSIAGVTAQNQLITQAGHAMDLMHDRARLATSMTNSANGNTLTLGFDTDTDVDSDGDGKSYNDRNRFERFSFVGVNSTNFAACASNQLVYFPNITATNSRVLIPTGVRNLPGLRIFTITNQVITILRLGIVDSFKGDFYQAIDLQGTVVSMNRPTTTNTIVIFP